MADVVAASQAQFRPHPVVTAGPYLYDPEDGGFTAQNGAVNA